MVSTTENSTISYFKDLLIRQNVMRNLEVCHEKCATDSGINWMEDIHTLAQFYNSICKQQQ